MRLVPDDSDAIRTKLFLLLQTDQYGEALKLLDADSSGKQPRFGKLEKTYVLYRLHREDEARDILDGLGAHTVESARGLQHLDAQLVRWFVLRLPYALPE